jgi:hypothetical protein
VLVAEPGSYAKDRYGPVVKMSEWIFQANPKRYDLLSAAKKGVDDKWSMAVHRQRVSVGDRVWFLIAGSRAGLYVQGSVISPVYEAPADEFGRWKVDVSYDNYIEPPLLRAELRADQRLANFKPLLGIMGTNFYVPREVADTLDELTKGRLTLNRAAKPNPPLSSAEELDRAIEKQNEVVRRQVKDAINKLSPDEFERFIGRVLEALGYEDIQVVGRTGDGGVDVRATLSLQGLTNVPTSVQAKTGPRTVPPKVVREMRGSLGVNERGLVIATGEFSLAAQEEATAREKVSIGLLGGEQLTRLCLRNGIGVVAQHVPVFKLDETKLTG